MKLFDRVRNAQAKKVAKDDEARRARMPAPFNLPLNEPEDETEDETEDESERADEASDTVPPSS